MSTDSPGRGQSPWRRHWPRLTPSAMLTAILPAALTVAGLTTPAPAAATAALGPPPVTVLTPGTDNGNGDIFHRAFRRYQQLRQRPGDHHQHRPRRLVPSGSGRAGGVGLPGQAYDGQPVLTWWQGTGLGGLSSGTDYIYNDRYQQVATVSAGNGYHADGHEFLITPGTPR